MKRLLIINIFILSTLSAAFAAPPRNGAVRGRVAAGGRPVAGVVVSDGDNFAVTDSKGVFSLESSEEAPFVFIVTPSGYVAESEDGFPRFYLPRDGRRSYDFELKAFGSPDGGFELLAIGDPQPQTEEHMSRLQSEIMPALTQIVEECRQRNALPEAAILLGDIVWDRMYLMPRVREIFSTLGIPVYPVIGNHDHEFPTANEKEARAKYESFFGPVDYSFNRGDVHIVSMDNIIHECQESAGYTGGFSAEQYEWLKQDLSYVPKDKMVILCVHIPFRNSKYAYYDEVLELLSQYKYATIMSAHTHSNINHIHTKNGKEIFEHVTGTSCGAWWRSTVCTEGTPIGFGIYRIEGAAMKEWNYKSVQHGEDFQIRLYRGSDKFTGGGDASYYFSKKNAGQIVANIWNWDPAWTVNVYENGAKTGTMTQYSDKDAWTVAYHIGILNNSSSYNKATDHMFYYTLTNPDADVKVEAIDRFGNKYEQTVFTDPDSHPGIYHLDY